MSANTLYDVLKPIIFLISIYGVKMRIGTSVRWVTKGLRLLLWLHWPICLSLYLTIFGSKINNLMRYKLRIKLFACALCFVYLKWKIQSFNVLLATLTKIKKSEHNEKAFQKVGRVLFLAYGFVFLENLYIWMPVVIIALATKPENYGYALLILAAFIGPIITIGITIFVCVIITFFVCLVVYYVSLSFDGPMEELKQFKSPLRRAKMTTKLIQHFYQTNNFIRVTDTFAAPIMFILKITSVLQFFTMVYFWEHQQNMQFGDCVSLYPTFIYLWFLRSAPSVNLKLSQLYQTLRESVMEDDLWLSRDPTSRPHLLRLRLSQLEQLTHLSLVQAQFTVLNEPVDEADVFSFFVEMFDTRNSINSAAE